jgi:hypothetical protein
MPKTAELKSAQNEKFVKAARELGCEESEEHFNATLAKVARHKPVSGHSSNTEQSKETAKNKK